MIGNSLTQLVVFGARGDLAQRKLVPALAQLAAGADGLFDDFMLIGVSRSDESDLSYRAALARARPESARDGFARLEPRVFYRRADVSDRKAMQRLAAELHDLAGGRACGRLFYLALAPGLFAVTVENLAAAGLLAMREGERSEWRRVMIEKPFGCDLASARALNRELHAHLREEQIFRIDHYLAKETVQNLLGLRFHNAVFEPIWNRHHIESVQITVAETAGVERARAAYYETTGALRDVVQNHMLQLLALIAMEPPASLDPEAIRDQKVQVLRGLRRLTPARDSVRARYCAGAVGGARVAGYPEEAGVSPNSQVETYVALRAEVESWRWSGVPFFLRHGKRLARRFTDVQIHFRTPPVRLFNRPEGLGPTEVRAMIADGTLCPVRPNVLSLRIQPDESIALSIGVKEPGTVMRMAPAALAFNYLEHFGAAPPEPYGRVLLDALVGDQTLFLRADEIEAAWEWTDGLRSNWEQADAGPLLEYPAGSWGPAEAHEMVRERCGAEWSHG